MFAAVDVLSINQIAFEAEGFLYEQEYEAENIGFGRKGLFQKYKVGRVLKRGGKDKAAFGIVACKFAVKQVVHFCSVSCRPPETSAAFFCRFAGAHQNARRVLPFRFIGVWLYDDFVCARAQAAFSGRLKKQPAPRQFFIDCTGAGMRPPRFTNTSQLPSFTGITGA